MSLNVRVMVVGNTIQADTSLAIRYQFPEGIPPEVVEQLKRRVVERLYAGIYGEVEKKAKELTHLVSTPHYPRARDLLDEVMALTRPPR